MAAESRNLRQSWPDTDCADTVGNCGNGYKMGEKPLLVPTFSGDFHFSP